MISGRIALVKELGEDFREFRLDLDLPFSYIPGQYVMIAYPGEEEKHAFSVVEHDPGRNQIILLVKKHGPFTSKLFESGAGQELDIYGPYGRFILPEEERELIFVAGGIGITPIYSMMMGAVRSGYSKKIHIFYTAKTPESMPLYGELSRLKNRNVDIEFHFTSQGKRLSAQDLGGKVPDMDSCMFYICGPTQMIDGFRHDLEDMGIDEELIRSEEFK